MPVGRPVVWSWMGVVCTAAGKTLRLARVCNGPYVIPVGETRVKVTLKPAATLPRFRQLIKPRPACPGVMVSGNMRRSSITADLAAAAGGVGMVGTGGVGGVGGA